MSPRAIKTAMTNAQGNGFILSASVRVHLRFFPSESDDDVDFVRSAGMLSRPGIQGNKTPFILPRQFN